MYPNLDTYANRAMTSPINQGHFTRVYNTNEDGPKKRVTNMGLLRRNDHEQSQPCLEVRSLAERHEAN